MEGIKNVFIIGAMKCGTTSLYNYLVQHPEICGGKYKEPEYFSLNMPGENPQCKAGRYEELFDIDSLTRFTIDASTGYSKFPAEKGVPSRMMEYGVDPYFIYIIRDPFDRIESHFNFMREHLNWKNKIDSDHLVNTSNYYLQLRQYEEIFGKDHILIVDFDELKANPLNVCNEVYDFIGASAQEIDYTFEVRNVTRPVNRNRVRLKQWTSWITKLLPARVSTFTSKVWDKVFPPGRKIKLTRSQREDIRNELAGDMQSLQREYGVDVSRWGFSKSE